MELILSLLLARNLQDQRVKPAVEVSFLTASCGCGMLRLMERYRLSGGAGVMLRRGWQGTLLFLFFFF